ncbi:MAG: 2-dehydropantoate 2-reductase [Acidobacteria bacterium]|nr:2-dehydropantoate 2-reductase [Acidobacteriota bacterium]
MEADPIRIAVIGAGGVGGYFGGKLAAAGIDTTFIVRGATLEALRTRGLRVESIGGDFTVDPVQATDDPSTVGPVDAILLAVKAWQIPEAAAAARPMVGPDTIAVPLENGMEAPEQIAAALGREHAFGGLCGIVSFIVEPGHIRHTAFDPLIVLGELDNARSPRAERLRAALEGAGIKADIPIDIHRSMWTKFLFIAPMSGIGALTRVPIGVWRSQSETRELVTRAVEEVLAVANARGVTLDPDAIAATLARYDNLPPQSTSSLQRDVMEGKPSELDAQLGAVARLGRAAGVATPICDLMYAALLPQDRKARGELS